MEVSIGNVDCNKECLQPKIVFDLKAFNSVDELFALSTSHIKSFVYAIIVQDLCICYHSFPF